MAERGNKLNTELKEVALQLPASAQDIAQLEVGSIVYLSGIVYTAREGVYAVSYTHLTLPTIYSV